MTAERELRREIGRIPPGAHLCLVYDTAEEQLAAVVPYIEDGLARRDRCVYIVDERSVDEIELALASAGVDLDRERRRGALVILTKRDAYLRSGIFDPEAMIAFLREAIERAAADGFAGLSITGEMTWALGPETGNDRLIEYENKLNRLLPTTGARAVCQYNRRLFPPAIIRDVLRTHPVAIVGSLVCPNVFYEPPDMLLGRRSIAEETTWRIQQLKSARATARALERTEEAQRLLGDATSILVSSLDHESTLPAVARLLVQGLADFCAFDLRGRDGLGDFVALAHADPSKEPLARAWRRRSPPGREDEHGVGRVLRTGRPEVLDSTSNGGAAPLRAAAAGELAELGWTFALIEPLSIRGETLGALTLATGRESERRLAEEDRALVEELARRAATAVDNARLYRRANDAITARDDFLAVAAHELRTPLTRLQLQIQLLQRQGRELVKEPEAVQRFQKQLAVLLRQTVRLGQLVGELLDVPRVAAGRLTLNAEDVDLSQLVAGVLADYEPQAASARCELVRDLEPGIVGRWDRARLEQVVSSLVSNALKYGAGKPVTVRTSGRDGAATLVVADQGIGIAPEDQQRIFGEFERAVSLSHYGGLGLGLFLAKRVLDAMGGRVEVTSAPGRGATFTVTLPRNAEVVVTRRGGALGASADRR